jgi:hypothetical protein
MTREIGKFLFGLLTLALLLGSFVFPAAGQDEISSPIEQINNLVEKVWEDFSIRPSGPASENEWCRRVFLDVLGRVPSVDELDEFLGNRSSEKKSELVVKLLYDDAYTAEFARNWSTIWTNLLIGRTGGNNPNTMTNRTGLQKYLRDSFARNKPYDELVRELIVATGSTAPGEEDFNGATNYLIDKVNDENASQATASTSRIFLGLQVQCTQCHNHPFNDWTQQKYWEINAFFRQVRAFRGGATRMDDGPSQLRDQDFGGETVPPNPDEAAIFYELRNGISKVAYPVFVDGTEISRSGLVKVVNRRQEFGDLVVGSPFLARAMVNRMWAHFLGYGFTNPVDDLGPHNIPANPELLELLSQQFRSHSYDVRRLISWIVLSRPYSLSSKPSNGNRTDDPLLGEPPKFSRFYLRQMRAEELYESLLVATGASQNAGTYEQQEQLKNRWLQQFSQAFGTDEGGETTTFNGTIPQVLMMFNGELIKNATGDVPNNLIQRLAEDPNLKDIDRIEHLFKSGYSRRPTKRELRLATDLVSARGNSIEAMKDIWWVILNSNEFIFNH